VANRADAFTYTADPITGGTPTDAGSAWVTPSSSYGANGSVMYLNSGTNALLDCGATDHEAGVSIVSTSGAQSGVRCRDTGNGLTGYAYLFASSGGAGALYKLPAFDELDTGGTADDGDEISIRVVGTTITGYVNGVEQVSATDGTHTTGTYGGVYSGNTYDDFYITDLTAGGGGGFRSRVAGGLVVTAN
jgi:hypothetical protein